jgi:peptidoglycan/LPS O-acetylase OafA/YrhL
LQHPKYRPDIDGLRALAVLLVVIYHAFPQWLPAGFIGVDIFFVISGYLISQIVFENLHQGTFSFKEFYVRRVLRIFPALILVLLACYAYGWRDWLADDFALLGKHIAAGALFVSNIALWQESGYFDQSAELKPLLHLWSLGIEEQFYLIWPAFIFILWPSKHYLPKMILGIAIISFISNILTISTDPIAAFYAPWTRFWELATGSYLAYLHFDKNIVNQYSKKIKVSKLSPNQLSWVGLGLLAIAVLTIHPKASFPGWWALLPVGAALCWLAAGQGGWLNRTILSHPILVWIGLISYPLYLWHWPLLAFARMQEGPHLSLLLRFTLVGLAFVLAWLTYQWLEKPIRFHKTWRKTKWITLVILMMAVAYLGFNCFDRKGIAFRHKRLIQEISTYTFDKVAEQRQRTCFLMDKGDDVTHYERECTRTDRPFKLVLWGDSHGGSMYPGFASLEQAHPVIGVSQFTAAGCGGLLPSPNQEAFCKTANELALKQINKIQPNLLVIYKAWHAENAPLLTDTIYQMKKDGVPVLIIGPTPRWTIDLPNIVYRFWKKNKALPPLYSNSFLDPSIEAIDRQLKQATLEAGGKYFSAWDLLCKQGEGCMNRLPQSNNALITLDEDHITPAVARFIMDAVYRDAVAKMLDEQGLEKAIKIK